MIILIVSAVFTFGAEERRTSLKYSYGGSLKGSYRSKTTELFIQTRDIMSQYVAIAKLSKQYTCLYKDPGTFPREILTF